MVFTKTIILELSWLKYVVYSSMVWHFGLIFAIAKQQHASFLVNSTIKLIESHSSFKFFHSFMRIICSKLLSIFIPLNCLMVLKMGIFSCFYFTSTNIRLVWLTFQHIFRLQNLMNSISIAHVFISLPPPQLIGWCAPAGFLPEEWDKFFVKYLYPSFTPTVSLFVAGTVAYGVSKYLQNEKLKGDKS